MSRTEEKAAYLDTMLYLMEDGYIDASGASAQYWEDFSKWDEIRERRKDNE